MHTIEAVLKECELFTQGDAMRFSAIFRMVGAVFLEDGLEALSTELGLPLSTVKLYVEGTIRPHNLMQKTAVNAVARICARKLRAAGIAPLPAVTT